MRLLFWDLSKSQAENLTPVVAELSEGKYSPMWMQSLLACLGNRCLLQVYSNGTEERNYSGKKWLGLLLLPSCFWGELVSSLFMTCESIYQLSSATPALGLSIANAFGYQCPQAMLMSDPALRQLLLGTPPACSPSPHGLRQTPVLWDQSKQQGQVSPEAPSKHNLLEGDAADPPDKTHPHTSPSSCLLENERHRVFTSIVARKTA